MARIPRGEDELLAWLSRQAGAGLIGDDAALLPGEGDWAVTVDAQIESVHFLPGLDPALLARRLLAVNLSDLAAVGARPAYAFLALAAPPSFDHRRFLRSVLAAARRAELELAGGDLASSRTLTATLTLLGRKPPDGRWLTRDSALPGDGLWLGGTVGESAAGALLTGAGARLAGRRVELPPSFNTTTAALGRAARRAVRRHLIPRAQLELGQRLGRTPRGAAIDLSDGLARDLHRLCRASGVGALVEIDSLPLAPGFRRLARELGHDWRRLALGGGEDYVLLFTLPDALGPAIGAGCRRIGRIVDGSEVSSIEAGRMAALPPLGWDHLEPSPSTPSPSTP